MSRALLLLSAVMLAYLAGSFPTAYLVGRANGIDLRTVGSGNLGATNVQRTLGWSWGLLVYLVDFLKGFVPTFFLPALVTVERGWPWGVAMGVAAIAGHVKPVFLMGKGGGKGVATASGVFLALAVWPTVAAIGAFLVVVVATRFVSLGSMVAAVVLAAVLLVQEGAFTPLAWVGCAIAMFVIWAHRENVRRLRRGEERRIGGRQVTGEAAP
ncbi:MAG: glycerol-3-phosphate 1-O-acyltransferase PlsY [Gemmatimonas sp.]|uniref:glycerol-3-phosphate 1-O-acyltransferase PlsY n=1 Tax=Gemmatimonas sp. TaxID=1962908 RepID=UPI00391F7400